jgi:hypothetical protein
MIRNESLRERPIPLFTRKLNEIKIGRSSGSGSAEILPIDEAKNFTQQW